MDNKLNTPKLVGQMIPTLARSLSNHKSTTSIVPDLINMLFEKYPDGTLKYKYFVIPATGEEVRHETLDDFLEAHTPHGIQCSREDLKKWADYAPDRIKKHIQEELFEELNDNGTNQHSKVGAVNNRASKNQGMKYSTSGEHYIISRLKRDNPELAQKVLAGELSPHQASIKTGIRKKYIQVQDNPAKLAEKLKATWSDEKLEELRILLYEL